MNGKMKNIKILWKKTPDDDTRKKAKMDEIEDL
jgi:hypothetical protein